MKKRRYYLKKSIAILLSLCLSFGPTAPGMFPAFADSGAQESYTEYDEEEAAEVTGEEAGEQTEADNEEKSEEQSEEEVSVEEEASGEEEGNTAASEDQDEEVGEELEAPEETGSTEEETAAPEETGSTEEETAAPEETGSTEEETAAPEETGSTEEETAAPEETGSTEEETAAPEETGSTEEETAAPEETGSTEEENAAPEETAAAEEIEEPDAPAESLSSEETKSQTTLQAEVEGTLISVIYDKGVFPEGAVLEVELLDKESEEQLEIGTKVLEHFMKSAEEDESWAAVNTLAFDIRILDEEGNELQPDTTAGKVKVNFAGVDRPLDQSGNLAPDEALHVFHMQDAGDETEELKKIEVEEDLLLQGELLSAEGAVINDLSSETQTEEAANSEDATETPETASVTVEAEHFSLYILSYRLGGKRNNTAVRMEGATYSVEDMIRGNMLDDHGFNPDLGDSVTYCGVLTGSDVLTVNNADWSVTPKKSGNAVLILSYDTVNGGKTASWLGLIEVNVSYYEDGITSGMCGVNAEWYISGTKLYITGSGEIYDYYPDNKEGKAPWIAYQDKITAVDIGSGITGVGDYAFNRYKKLVSVSIPSTVERIGVCAFFGCSALKSIQLPSALITVDAAAFEGCNELGDLTIPASVTEIGSRAFYKTGMASNGKKNTITNNSSHPLYAGLGVDHYNPNYSTCPTGNVRYEWDHNDKTAPVIKSFEEVFYSYGAYYEATVDDNAKTYIGLYVFITTEDSVTDPNRVVEASDKRDGTYGYKETSSGYRYSILMPYNDLYNSDWGETILETNTDYYIYAVARDAAGNLSSVYKLPLSTGEGGCRAPTIYPNNEDVIYPRSQTFTLTNRTAGATMYYSFDMGSNWTEYTGPFTMAPSNGNTTTVFVRAGKGGYYSERDVYSFKFEGTGAKYGSFGTGATWKLANETADPNAYTLVIGGIGEVPDFADWSTVPWNGYRDLIQHIRIEDGITRIGNNTFHSLYHVTGEIIIPDSVKSLGKYAIYNLRYVTKLDLGNGLQYIGDYGLSGMYLVPSFTIPESVTYVGTWGVGNSSYSGQKQIIRNMSNFELTTTHYSSSTQVVLSKVKIQAFIRRLYTTCMGRTADANGLKYWTDRIMSGKTKGIALAANFVFSKEFTGKNYCNEHFVRQIYPALMNRTPDSGGLNYWVGQLDSGKLSREALLNSFASSTEYENLCSEAGFEIGDPIAVPKYGTQQYGPCAVCGKKSNVVQFVERMYTECLKRSADTGGLKYWSEALCKHTQTAKSLLHNFFLSQELKNQHLSNEEYVRRIYKAMLNRNPDSGGLKYWKERLDKGDSPTVVINSFIDSSEFKKICDDYGIQRK